jgi:flagellar biosynthesis protein FlhG
MMDQASELRKLVLQSVRNPVARTGPPPPRVIVVTAGKGGAGVTTLTVNLSVALAEQGARVVTVDADLNRSDVAVLCGLTSDVPARDLLVAGGDIHEVLLRGPAGIQILPGIGLLHGDGRWTEAAQQRVLRQFQTLGRHADSIVLDAGRGTSRFLSRCFQAADDVLLVTTHDPEAVMETYAHLKGLLPGIDAAKLRLMVNRCGSEEVLQDVHARLDRSCRRFLNRQVSHRASIPEDAAVQQAVVTAVPFVLSSPQSHAARAMAQLASALSRPKPAARDRRDAA